MSTQTGSISFEATGGFNSYAKQNYATLSQIKGQFATCSTGAAVAAKVATIVPADSGWTLYEGATVTVKFITKNTVTPTSSTPLTLNVNGTGAKPIKDYAGHDLTKAAYEWPEGTAMALTYDGSSWRIQDSNLMERVHTAETGIEQNSQDIKLKANTNDVYNKEDVNGLISKEVTDRNAAIELSATGITQTVSETYATKTALNNKADSSTVTALAERVTTAESTIEQHSTDITARVTKTEFKALETQKGRYFSAWPREVSEIELGCLGEDKWLATGQYQDFSKDFCIRADFVRNSEYLTQRYCLVSAWGVKNSTTNNAYPELGIELATTTNVIRIYTCSDDNTTHDYRTQYVPTPDVWTTILVFWHSDTGYVDWFAFDETERFAHDSFKPNGTLSGVSGEVWIGGDSRRNTTWNVAYMQRDIPPIWYETPQSGNYSCFWDLYETQDKVPSGASKVVCMAAGGAIDTAKSEIKLTTDAISTEVSKKVGNEEVISKINQSAETIKIQANRIEIDGTATFKNSDNTTTTLNNYLTNNYDAKGAAQEAVDNLEIGGRNYILNSAGILGDHLTSGNEYIAINVGQSYMDIPTGTQVTISFDLKMTVKTANPSILVYNTNNKGPKAFSSIATGTGSTTGVTVKFTAAADTTLEKRVSVTGYINDRTNPNTTENYLEFYSIYNTGNVFSISNLKLEMGNKATDWSPAPEDQITYVDESIDNIQVYVDESIDNIQVGGKNLLLNTGASDWFTKMSISRSNIGSATNTLTTDDDMPGFQVLAVTRPDSTTQAGTYTNMYVSDTILKQLEIDKTYTISFYAKASTTGVTMAPQSIAEAQTIVSSTATFEIATTWTRYSVTFIAKAAKQALCLYSSGTANAVIKYTKFQLESGNVVTDWAPAPEDVNAAIEQSVAGQGGFTILWNYEKFATANNGEGYICALDPTTGTKSDADGWVMWNGVKRTIPKGMINPNAAHPYNTPCYVVCRLSSATATTGTNYIVSYNDGWKGGTINAGALSAWTWNEATDIIIGKYVEPASEAAFVEMEIYNPPLSSKQITTQNITAARANSTANAAAPKSSAIARTQRIYWRATSTAGKPGLNNTWLSTSGTGYGNWALMVPQLTSGSTKYPYLYTAVQSQTVAQEAVASTECSCSPVLLDDTTTVIDGGKIITGSIDANAINADTISGSNLTISNFSDADDYLNSNIQVGGRNLVLDSNNSSKWEYTPAAYNIVKKALLSENLVKGDEYTITIWGEQPTRSDKAGSYAVFWGGGNVALKSGITIGDDGKGVATFTAPNNSHATTANAWLAIYNAPPVGASGTTYSSAITKLKLERGNHATDWSPAPEDTDSAISDAAKTATNYVTNITGGGIMVHPNDDDDSGWKISSTIELLKDNVSYIKAWLDNSVAKVRMGLENSGHSVFSPSGMEVFTNSTTSVASFGSMARIGEPNINHIDITSNGLSYYQGSAQAYSVVPKGPYEIITNFGSLPRNLASGQSITVSLPPDFMPGAAVPSDVMVVYRADPNAVYSSTDPWDGIEYGPMEQGKVTFERNFASGGVASVTVHNGLNHALVDNSVKIASVRNIGSIVMTIGEPGKSHIEVDYHSMQFVDKKDRTYFHVSDLRDADGYAELTEKFKGDGTTKEFSLQIQDISSATITCTDENCGTPMRTDYKIKYNTAPADGSTITVVYRTSSPLAKAFTFGDRSTNYQVGAMSVVAGYAAVAEGFASHAEGSFSIASGDYSHAEGEGSTASEYAAHAEGWQTKAESSASHSEGYHAEATGHYSHAEGSYSIASGIESHAEGNGTEASGKYGSHAEGYETIASGNYGAHAEGYGSDILNQSSGRRTEASGSYGAHAEGYLAIASGNSGAHAEGYKTTASGNLGAHSEGQSSVASGDSSHAQNLQTIASSKYQTALGKFNIADSADTYAVIIGNGTASARSNALAVAWDGTVETTGSAIAKDSAITMNDTPTGVNITSQGFYIKDSNGDVLSRMVARNYTSGRQGTLLETHRNVGGTDKYNTLNIGIDSNGNHYVSVSDAAAWRTGIGAVSKAGDTISGTLVLSKRQDASGTANNSPALIVGGTVSQSHIEIDDNEIQAKSNGTTPTTLSLNYDGGTVFVNDINITDVTTTNSIANIITAASGYTINNANVAVWGKICTFHVTLTTTAAIATGNIGNLTVGTLKAAYRPRISAAVSTTGTGPVAIGYIGTNGNLYIAAMGGALAANGQLSLGGTYVLA